ncbi:NAD-binding protein [Streptomyces sp. KLOTTS4A1]|uniref:NAD-binding protein n=1 Tax=Streptomyces sp. KLOTTS4A1 TaxID=3390996 RepID=UPI0039F4A19D
MIVCGDDALAQRLAGELREVYRAQVTLVVPPAGSRPQLPLTGRERAGALLGRVSAVLGRGSGDAEQAPQEQSVMEAAELNDEVLAEAGVREAAALALVNDDDETNIRAALAARRLNPRLRLVIRLYNRKLGQYLAELLDQATPLPYPPATIRDASTTVLSDADTAAPALAAAAVAGTRKVLQTDGLLLQAVEQQPGRRGEAPAEGLCTLALLSTTRDGGAGEGLQLLPDDMQVAAAAAERGTVVLQTVQHSAPALAPRRAARGAPLRELFSRQLRFALAGLLAAVLALAVTSSLTTHAHPLHATYTTLLDLFALNDPATDGPHSRQILQLLAALAGLLLLPVLLAAALEAFGTFRTASALRRPPRGLSDHVVLLGLGKIGSRVLTRLRDLDIPVVCVEEDPEARGIPQARRLRVPVVLGDVAEEGVLEAAKIHRAHSLLALTSIDTTNLEAALYARSVKPDLGVVLRVYDDEFATAVFRTLSAAHPRATTRSRSVTTLAAPAFAGAMMGRSILGAIPVEREVLLFAALDVAEHSEMRDRTVTEAFRPGFWRVVALDTSAPAQRLPDLSITPSPYSQGHTPGLVWNLHPGQVLTAEDRVVVVATRRGLAELLGGRRGPGRVGPPRTGGPE